MISAPAPLVLTTVKLNTAPLPRTAGIYSLGSNVTPNFAAGPNGSLSVSSKNISGQTGAFLRGARLVDGGSFEAQFTVNAASQVRFGILVADTPDLPVKTGHWYTLENPGVVPAAQRVRVLQYEKGTFNFLAPTAAVKGGPILQAGQTYRLKLSRAGQKFTLSIGGLDVLTEVVENDWIGEEPYVGVQVGFFGPQRSYMVMPTAPRVTLTAPRSDVKSAIQALSVTPPQAQLHLIRAGRPGYDFGPASALQPVSTLERELISVVRAGPYLYLAGRAAAPGALLGLSEPATDPSLPLWDGITLAGQARTTVNPVTRTVQMLCQPGSGYAFKTKLAFDPAHDVTLDFYATLEQVRGQKAWLGGVLWVAENSAATNYIGVNINRDITGPTHGQTITALYGDEKFTNRQPIAVALGAEHHHRLIWDARTQRVLWYMDGQFRSAKPWKATGPIRAWIGSVAQDSVGDAANQSRATFRDVQIVGTPLK